MTIGLHDDLRLTVFRAVSFAIAALFLTTASPVWAQAAWETEWKELQAKAKAESKLSVALGGSSSRVKPPPRSKRNSHG